MDGSSALTEYSYVVKNVEDLEKVPKSSSGDLAVVLNVTLDIEGSQIRQPVIYTLVDVDNVLQWQQLKNEMGGFAKLSTLFFGNTYIDGETQRGFSLFVLDMSKEEKYSSIYPFEFSALTINKGTSSQKFTGLTPITIDIPDAYSKTESDNKYVAKSGYVAYTQDEKTKLNGIESGAQKNPTSLKNPNKLTITVNGSATEYDGSEVKNITITIPDITALTQELNTLKTTVSQLEEKVNQLSGQ